jgi:hypothetical protein
MFPVLFGICGWKSTTWKRGVRGGAVMADAGYTLAPMWPVLFANAAWVLFLSVWALVYFAGARKEQGGTHGK